ncbi:MAG TPA: diaminopimelate decarboxylase [Saprospiraceae bacterium]|nr:diaminopimelate decarboxylase [Saprospiraceae bacterium]
MKISDGKYRLSDGIDPLDLISRYDCPLYVYDCVKIEEQYRKLTGAFHWKNTRIFYACKALSNLNILQFMNYLGAGLDTVSIQEVHLGLKAGYQPDDIMYTPNCVSLEEISMAVDLGVKINIDNISILEQFGQRYPKYPVCVRVNPHIMAGGNSKISTGHIDSKFGISVYQMPLVKRIVQATGLKINGLHMHTGSEILDVDVYLKGAEILLNTAEEFNGLEYIDFGSGFKVPYKDDGIETNTEELGMRLSGRFGEFCKNYGYDLQLIIEPGKYLVSEAGIFLTKVNVVKHTTSTVFAGVDSGLNHLIRPMFYDAYHKIVNVSNPEGKQRIYTVVGYICETDTFGINRRITEIREGDILAFFNAGAYCYMMSSNYNSRYRPAEVMLLNGKDYLIRKRETFDDLVKNQIEQNLFIKEHA